MRRAAEHGREGTPEGERQARAFAIASFAIIGLAFAAGVVAMLLD